MEKKLKKINVIVIGLGRIGLHYAFDDKRPQPASHISAIMDNSNLKLVGVCDMNDKSIKKFQQKYSKKVICANNYLSLINKLEKKDVNFDIIVIATPDKTHFDILNSCISTLKKSNTKKIIFCEKPVTDNLLDAKKLKKSILHSKINLVVNHSRRWSKIWQEAFRFKSQIGKIQKAGFYFSTSPENKNISQIRDGIHMADVISWFKIKKITSINRLNVNYFVYDFHMWGSEGKVEILNFGTELRVYKTRKSEHFKGFYELKLIRQKNIYESYLKNVYQEFVNYFEKKKLLSCTMNDAIEAMKSFEEYVYVKNLPR